MKNRKIKFRIWNSLTKKFTFKLPKEFHFTHKRFSVQQFTGLLDKQGKEIYEGDIVDYYIDGYKQTNPLIVDHKNLIIGLNHDDKYYQMEEETLEVIGNIYENKDLIK